MIQQLLDDHQNVISCLAKAFHEVKHLIPVSKNVFVVVVVVVVVVVGFHFQMNILYSKALFAFKKNSKASIMDLQKIFSDLKKMLVERNKNSVQSK